MPSPAPSYPFTDAEAALLALRCLDLTSLRDDDSAESITALAERAVTAHGAPAALCVYAAWVPTARRALDARGLSAVRIATVVNFPRGDSEHDTVVGEVEAALAAGADEIDCVFPWRALQAGDRGAGERLINRVRLACDAAGAGSLPRVRPTLKVILESGELQDPALIEVASRIALAGGADFLKTSTGKTAHHATPEAATVMLAAIAATGTQAGLKISGGVARIADVQTYLALAAGVYGRDALTPQNFRFGASGLLTPVLATPDGQVPPPAASGY